MSITVFILTLYMLPRYETTTVIPCITSTWYKIYTGLLILATLGVFLVAALETRNPHAHVDV